MTFHLTLFLTPFLPPSPRPPLPAGFYKLHERTEDDTDDHVRELLVELSLTVPARLSSMVPFVALLMRMIVQVGREERREAGKKGMREE